MQLVAFNTVSDLREGKEITGRGDGGVGLLLLPVGDAPLCASERRAGADARGSSAAVDPGTMFLQCCLCC